jgi:hypothetical protein
MELYDSTESVKLFLRWPLALSRWISRQDSVSLEESPARLFRVITRFV